jgi:NADP-dependent 3-hydroxy acid dehydrogenase YdfG
MTGIADKVIAITGAGSGIGAATARLLAGRGARLMLGARRTDRLADVASEIVAAGGAAAHLGIDVRQRADLVGFVNQTCARFGRLDVLVSNAGVGRISPLDDLRVDEWEQMIDVNLKGVLYGIAAALPVFRQQGSGHFVNVISTAGLRIVPLQAVYAGTKNAVRTISEGLRQEAAGKLRVTGISPGYVKTGFADHIENAEAREMAARQMAEIAISPDAVARAIAFAIEQPDDVDVGDIVIRPTAQA